MSTVYSNMNGLLFVFILLDPLAALYIVDFFFFL